MKPLQMQRRPGKIKAAILSWLGVPLDLTSPALYTSGLSDSGMIVNEKTAMSLSAAWACTRLISETIATLPLSIYERTPTGKRIATEHPLHTILHDQPNPESTASVYWESSVSAMLLRGTAYVEKLIVGSRVVGLMFLAPQRLRVSVVGGKKEYTYLNDDGSYRKIPASRIWAVPGFSFDGKNGVSVISYGANVFGSALAATQAANATFKNGLMPTTYYKMEAVLKPEQREQFRENLKEISGAINAGKSPLLEGGMSIGEVGINPGDAQLLESRAFNVEEICRMFRVPPWMVGHTEKSTSWGSGIEQQMLGFLTFTLAPWLRRIEQSINKDLLTPAERQRYYAKFAVEGLLRADSKGRAEFYSRMVNNGIFTRDEVRELEDREAMGGNAAVLTVQTALAPLDDIGLLSDEARALKMAVDREERS